MLKFWTRQNECQYKSSKSTSTYFIFDNSLMSLIDINREITDAINGVVQ